MVAFQPETRQSKGLAVAEELLNGELVRDLLRETGSRALRRGDVQRPVIHFVPVRLILSKATGEGGVDRDVVGVGFGLSITCNRVAIDLVGVVDRQLNPVGQAEPVVQQRLWSQFEPLMLWCIEAFRICLLSPQRTLSRHANSDAGSEQSEVKKSHGG